jgi:hypothetical protein
MTLQTFLSPRSVSAPARGGVAAIWRWIGGGWRNRADRPFALRALSVKAQRSGHRLIAASRYFDPDWYRDTYPDVAKSREDPILHYLRLGAAEGRDPSELFSTGWYLHQNTDVAKAGINPLLHFLKSGEREGRSPQARRMPAAVASGRPADGAVLDAAAAQASDTLEVASRRFDVAGAFLLELRVGLVTEDRSTSSVQVQIEFRDENDDVLPAAFSRAEWSAAHATLLVLPQVCLDEDSRPLCCSTRFLSPPYGTKSISVAIPLSPQVRLDRIECTPVDISGSCDLILDGTEQYERARRKFLRHSLKRLGIKVDEVGLKADARSSLDSLRVVVDARNRNCDVDWRGLLEAYSPQRDMAWSYDRERRMKTMPSAVVATICGDRLSSILSKHFTVVRLTDDEWKDRLAWTGASMIVIETIPSDVLGDWNQALLGLDGAVSEKLRSLLAWAGKKRLPVVAYVTASTAETGCYRELLAAANHVIVESCRDDETPLEAAGVREHRVLPSFERRLAGPAPVSERPLEGTGIVFANASDLYQLPAVASVVSGLPVTATLITEATFDIYRVSQEEYGIARHFVTGSLQYRQLLHVWRCAAVAVFCEDTLVTKERQAQMVLDALGCGAVPIFVGDSRTLGNASRAVLQVHDRVELADLLAFMTEPMARELAWLRLYRDAVATMSFERSTLPILARVLDRAPPAEPKALCVLASKRPARIRQFIQEFAKQTYRNKELVVVLNCEPSPEVEAIVGSDLPPGVQVKCVGATPNIGWCLNLAINSAECDYWFKMDDDDHYGPNYLADLINQMVASGADAGGKPPFVVHLNELSITLLRRAQLNRGRRFLKFREYACGATICGRKGFVSRFSYRTRHTNDTEWNEYMHVRGGTVYLADAYNFAVARSDNLEDHTWKAPNSWFLSKDFLDRNDALVTKVGHPLQHVSC